MRVEPEDEFWAARRLSAEAERYGFDRDAFRGRVLAQVQAAERAERTGAAGSRRRDRDAVPGRWLTGGSRSPRLPGPLRPEPGPRSLPAMVAAAAIVVIAVAGSVMPGLRAWGGDDRTGASSAAAGTRGGAVPSPVPTRELSTDPPSLTAPALPATPPPTRAVTPATLSGHFSWTSGQPLVSAHPDAAHPITGLKDPSVVYDRGTWHVFATALGGPTPTLVQLSFTDWARAGSAQQYFLDRSAIGTGYRAAPQVFWFAPQKLWYLVYQTGTASYSTNPDLNDPTGWSAPKNFYPAVPDIVRKNVGDRYWVDMWVICDAVSCSLFSTDQQGHLYRSRTALADFPNGMSEPVVALQDPIPATLMNSTAVYRVAGTGRYLLVVEAVGSDGAGYLRSWTATGLDGPWTPLAATEANPFARSTDVAFDGNAWTRAISHGELLRSGIDQTLTVDPCRLRYLYHGQTNQLGLLTQKDPTCS